MRYSTIFTFLFFVHFSFAQTSLQGFLTDSESGEPIMFGTVILYNKGVLVTGLQTDLNGHYELQNIEAGVYDIEFSSLGYINNKVTGVKIKEGKVTVLSQKLSTEHDRATILPVYRYSPPVIEPDNLTQGFIFSADQIRNMPHRGN